MQLIKNNAEQSRIRLETDDTTGVAHLYLYDVIDSFFGVSAKDLAEQLTNAGSREVYLHINSPGGDVFEARAMKALIAGHPQPVTALIEGAAVSAATAVCNACSRVVATEDSLYMIHQSWTFAMGNADELRTTAALLEKVDGQIVDEYERKTGKPREEIVSKMAAETWFTAQEAKAFGLVDEVVSASQSGKNWNYAAYNNAPSPREVNLPGALDAAVENQTQSNRNKLRLLLNL